jgi:murein DD-endopeptidase MepM/ murein hydrolase activator NlpD
MNRRVIHLLVRLVPAILILPALRAMPEDGAPRVSPEKGEPLIHPDEGAPRFLEIEELHFTDPRFLRLYESTVASKKRILDGTRLDAYEPPLLYRYTLKRGEDLWTIIARTSLNIDTIATLNKLDFIGMIREETTVLLPDTLGVFHRPGESGLQAARDELAVRYGVPADEVLVMEDPPDVPAVEPTGGEPGPLSGEAVQARPSGEEAASPALLFVPEVTLSFLARTYLTGVVFHTPLMGIESSSFGMRVDPFINEEAFHGGVDFAVPRGKKVHAARWGTVLFAGEGEGYGNTVVLRHQLGYHTLYAHLDELLVEADEQVISGQVIGTVGETGRTTGPHLHFEIRRFDARLDPGNIPFFLPELQAHAP